jgi:hypothetical protein
MNRVLIAVILVGCSAMSAASQDSVEIKVDRNDPARPLSTLLKQMRKREGVAVTYEDPRYNKRADMRGPDMTFSYSAQALHDPDGDQLAIARMLREYGASGGLTFSIVRDANRLNVVPTEVLDAAGKRVRQGSILDTAISIPPARRDGSELLQAICDAIKKETGYEIGVGPSAPDNILVRYSTMEGVDNVTARSALAHLLDSSTHPGSFVWDLYFDPADGGYGLNFAYVGPARRAGE